MKRRQRHQEDSIRHIVGGQTSGRICCLSRSLFVFHPAHKLLFLGSE